MDPPAPSHAFPIPVSSRHRQRLDLLSIVPECLSFSWSLLADDHFCCFLPKLEFMPRSDEHAHASGHAIPGAPHYVRGLPSHRPQDAFLLRTDTARRLAYGTATIPALDA